MCGAERQDHPGKAGSVVSVSAGSQPLKSHRGLQPGCHRGESGLCAL